MSDRAQPALHAGRLLLRAWRDADAEALLDAYADQDIQRWHARTVESLREAQELINEWKVPARRHDAREGAAHGPQA
jgi:[ribosomal protein S5]-alanine N-acetyltransferase